MNIDKFWALIDEARVKFPDKEDKVGLVPKARVDWMTERLKQLSAEEITIFEAIWNAYTLQVDQHKDLEEVATKINGGFSDDGWIDFKAWMIAQGRENFQKIMADPFYIRDMGAEDLWAELWGYVKQDALKLLIGPEYYMRERGTYVLEKDKLMNQDEIDEERYGPEYKLIRSLVSAIRENGRWESRNLNMDKIGEAFARVLESHGVTMPSRERS